MLLSNYLLFASLNKHFEFCQDNCLETDSNIKEKYTGFEKILLSVRDFYKIYLLVMIFIYPIPRFNEINTSDNLSIWLIFIQTILITKFICDKKDKKG